MMNVADKASAPQTVAFVDLFCGIGGFRIGVETLARANSLLATCVFSSDIDSDCRQAYEENFGDPPAGDITLVNDAQVPSHELLLAGFPCQPFSIIGHMKGFADIRGTLFFHIARMLKV